MGKQTKKAVRRFLNYKEGVFMDCMRYDSKVLIVNLSELVQFSCLQLTDTYLPYLRKNHPLLRLFSLDKALSSKTHM